MNQELIVKATGLERYCRMREMTMAIVERMCEGRAGERMVTAELEEAVEVEEDVRSIEAENVGDDDELDADLEREFLLQEEAKSRFRAASSLAAEEEEEDHARSGGFHTRSTTDAYEDVDDDAVDQIRASGGRIGKWRTRGREFELDRVNRALHREETALGRGDLIAGALLKELNDDEEVVVPVGLSTAASLEFMQQQMILGGSEFIAHFESEARHDATAGNNDNNFNNNLTLFPDFEPAVEMGMNKTKTAADRSVSPNDGGVVRSDEVDELLSYQTAFQVPFPTGKEEVSNKWLRLGLPSNSNKYSHSGDKSNNSTFSNSFQQQRRNIVSGSSSKVSVRTGTSLERQYSTGSTSTVESPHFIVQERTGSDGPRPSTREPPHSSGGAPRLTFSFPGWGVDISKGEKHHPSVVNHQHHLAVESAAPESFGGPPKRLRESSDPSATAVSRGKAVEENLGDRSPVWELPDEILLQVMRRLEIRDLCSSVQSCKRWYAVGLQNDLWELFLGDVDRGLLSDSSSDVLPRWVCKKNLCLSQNVRVRFNVFSKGYDYLRRALHEWWDNGLHSSRYPSKGIYSLIRKLTASDWSLLYEALGVAFTDRTDRIASMFLRKLKPAGLLTGGTSSAPLPDEKRDCNVGVGSLAALYENPKSNYSLAGSSSEFEVHWKSGSVKEVSHEEGVVGKELWELLLKSWKRYKGWLHLISTHCQDLNHEVMIERARSQNWTATPTLYNKGLICFRSQVVLRYGLRNVLQAGFMYLTTQDARDWSSEQDMDLLRSSHHLLQELDVTDDFTLPVKSHTQTKLRQCFRSALATTNSKLALHKHDKLNYL